MRASDEKINESRREWLRNAFLCAGVLAARPILGFGGEIAAAKAGSAPLMRAADFGPLGAPDANGIRLPAGFTSRVVARQGFAPTGSPYLWHRSPDGGSTYSTPDGGWIYVSNSEVASGGGGAGAIRFNSTGAAISAYSILQSTSVNCAGGKTPWNTWLSCEEVSRGVVWECDPFGVNPAVARFPLGSFQHEAAAVDPVHQRVYLTEDRSDGCLYRFTPTSYPDLGSGLLEVAIVSGTDPNNPRPVTWAAVPNPNPATTETSTRYQVAGSTPFNGGEGMFYSQNIVYFTTKGDNRVWAYDTVNWTLDVIYSPTLSPPGILTGVDNIVVSSTGDIFVAEDGGDMQIVAIRPGNQVVPLLQIENQSFSEIAGPAFDPSGTRLYFSSQRGPSADGQFGITYEVTGPFLTPAPQTVTVAGRVLTRERRGLKGAVVTLSDPQGPVQEVTSGNSGNFTFSGVEAGQNYVISVRAKRYTFNPRTVEVNGNVTNIEMIAN